MSEITRLKWLFAILYFVQGGAISYFSIFQKPYLNQVGISRSSIGLLTSILLLPFVLKVGFGFLSDKVFIPGWGRRKPFMVIGLALACLSFCLAGVFPPSKYFFLYAVFVVCASFCVALFDASTDGLAVDRIPEDEQGSVQSYMVAGKAIGVIFLSLMFGNLVEGVGYRVLFFILSGVFLLPLFLTLKIKVTEETIEQESHQPDESVFKSPAFLFLGLLATTYSFISFGCDGLISLYLNDFFKLSESQIGFYGSLRGVGAIVGAFMAGKLMHRGYIFRTAATGLLMLALGTLMIGQLIDGDNFKLLGPIWGMVWGFQEVCFLTLAMRAVSSYSSALAFAALMALGNLGTAIGEGVATTLTASMNYPSVFSVLAGAIVIPVLIFIKFSKLEKAQAT